MNRIIITQNFGNIKQIGAYYRQDQGDRSVVLQLWGREIELIIQEDQK